ncbi:GyrI-like domain-containing protein [Paenibacillus woosongensis]|uniref:GyrI-like domain-containing protein n=1 Tax=Paenibacillus woosongensis TaxID=307580 RepID=A0AA95L2Q4_9BACL|nr:GyrI-like domain-containing protein [Paenibacillus woosongensis]WHX50951.1 GyrI-like domain-containing protein [Paenibacillus woosongensis]
MNLNEIVETYNCKRKAFILIGFSGQSMEEEKHLFRKLNERMNEITNSTNKLQYLVVSGKYPTPFVGAEVTDSQNVPEGMNALTIPAEEYVAFKFKKEHVGDFWENVCTIDNQERYQIDLSKPRFEIFKPDQQNTELLEWFIPTNTNSIIRD